MEQVLSNSCLTVLVDSFGAELHSIKKDGLEYLWQADPKFWARHAPILFPIVGKLKEGRYHLNDESYELTSHGFARDHEFELKSASSDRLVYQLIATEGTRAVYPADFELFVTYQLTENKISVNYEVVNTGSQTMYYGIGGHPAFNVPIEQGSFEDYQLLIEGGAAREAIPLDPVTGLLKTKEKKSVKTPNISLKHDLFANDALIFSSTGKTTVRLVNSLDSREVAVSWNNMPYFGLWSPYPKKAPFVCIEPWSGLADAEDTTGDLSQKFAINQLEIGEKQHYSYQLEIL